MALRFLVPLLLFIAVAPMARAEPFRLNTALDLPDGLSVSGESRVRYETVDRPFRRGATGGDQMLAFRTLVLAEWRRGPVAFGVEVQDSRSYLGDDGTPYAASIINPLDVLQAYAAVDLPTPGARTRLKAGRLTLDIGSERLFERPDYSNAINTFTGLRLTSTLKRGDELTAIAVVPNDARPADRDGLANNRLEADIPEWNSPIVGLHYRRKNALAGLAPDIWLEGFVYHIEESDSARFQTPNRRYTEPGIRVFRAPAVGQWDVDIDASWRFGSRRAGSAATDVQELRVRASRVFASLGYTFDTAWQPRLSVDHYYASGDRDPADDSFDQYERLFGSRNSDLGTTGIFGPLAPANLSAPGLRLELRPSPRVDARLLWKAASLASARDAWTVAGLRDPSGASGRFIGHIIDARVRYWLVQDNVRIEIGGSTLRKGRFAKTAPGAPEADSPILLYTQLMTFF